VALETHRAIQTLPEKRLGKTLITHRPRQPATGSTTFADTAK
jgi:hypothetical protein